MRGQRKKTTAKKKRTSTVRKILKFAKKHKGKIAAGAIGAGTIALGALAASKGGGGGPLAGPVDRIMNPAAAAARDRNWAATNMMGLMRRRR